MRGRWASGDEWWRPMPPGASADALRILTARGVRAFGDGFVALLLPIYLVELGFSALAGCACYLHREGGFPGDRGTPRITAARRSLPHRCSGRYVGFRRWCPVKEQ